MHFGTKRGFDIGNGTNSYKQTLKGLKQLFDLAYINLDSGVFNCSAFINLCSLITLSLKLFICNQEFIESILQIKGSMDSSDSFIQNGVRISSA